MSVAVVDMFLQCDQAIRRGRLIHRTSRADKEFHFQDWFQERLDELKVLYDPPARNSYPDFRLVSSPVGYEIKGLAYPGREATYDANSQMPTGFHNGRTVYYAFGRYPKDSHQLITTRSPSEVQNSDAEAFTERLTLVLREMNRVLKDEGLLIFTYHHSRWEGWRSVLNAVASAGFRIDVCHPVKAEMSVATPKHQAKDPINFDIIMVCRKSLSEPFALDEMSGMTLSLAFGRAEAQIDKLRDAGWKLSRNDIGVVVMSQVVAEISRQPGTHNIEQVFEETKDPVSQTIDRLHSQSA